MNRRCAKPDEGKGQRYRCNRSYSHVCLAILSKTRGYHGPSSLGVGQSQRTDSAPERNPVIHCISGAASLNMKGKVYRVSRDRLVDDLRSNRRGPYARQSGTPSPVKVYEGLDRCRHDQSGRPALRASSWRGRPSCVAGRTGMKRRTARGAAAQPARCRRERAPTHPRAAARSEGERNCERQEKGPTRPGGSQPAPWRARRAT